MKIICKCGQGCDYQATEYEKVNKLACNNSRMARYTATTETIERDCMNCEATYTTTPAENADICPACRKNRNRIDL